MGYKIFYTNSPGESGFAMTNEHWERKVRYFKFAKCFHDYKELSKEESYKEGMTHFGMCYHVCKCINCGHFWSYDSSG